MKSQHIMFDLDDTLIHCNKYFFAIVDQFIAHMLDWFKGTGITEDEIRSKQSELDIAMVKAEGFASTHFPASLVLTYRYFIDRTGIRPVPQHENWLYKLGQTAFEQNFEKYPDMEETLDHLKRANHFLYLYTGGEKDIQWRKIQQIGLERYFEERIFISKHKTSEVMQEIIKAQELNPAQTWMIGNSIRTDVLPALQTGLNTIHIPVDNEWSYNQLELNIKPTRAFYTLTRLSEVPPIITSHSDSSN